MRVETSDLQNIAEKIPAGVCKVKADEVLTLLYANEFFYDMLGYKKDEIAKESELSAKFFVNPDDWDRVFTELNGYIRDGIYSFTLEKRSHKKDGTTIWTSARCRYYDENDGEIVMIILDETERKNAEDQLRIHEEEFRIASEQESKYVFRYDIATRTAVIPKNQQDAFGYSPVMDNLPYSAVERNAIAAESVAVYLEFFDRMNRGEKEGVSTARLNLKNGEKRWFRAKFTTVFSNEGKAMQAIVSYNDVTELREKEAAFEQYKQSFSRMKKNAYRAYEFDLSADRCDKSYGIEMNCAIDSENVTISELAESIAQNIFPEDKANFMDFFRRDRMIAGFYQGNREFLMEFRTKNPDGTTAWVRAVIHLVRYSDNDEIKMYCIFYAVNGQQTAISERERALGKDALTGVSDDEIFEEEFSRMLYSYGSDGQHALMLILVGNIEPTKERLGETFCNELLISIAADLKSILRVGDIVGRIGENKFALCMKNIPQEDDIENRMSNILAMLRQKLDAHSMTVYAGISTYPKNAQFYTDLRECAEIALDEAVDMGRSGYVIAAKKE